MITTNDTDWLHVAYSGLMRVMTNGRLQRIAGDDDEWFDCGGIRRYNPTDAESDDYVECLDRWNDWVNT